MKNITQLNQLSLRLPDSLSLRDFLKEKLATYEQRVKESAQVNRHSQDARCKATIIRLLFALGETDKKSVVMALAGQTEEMPDGNRIEQAWNVISDYIHNGGRGVSQPPWAEIPVPQVSIPQAASASE